MPHEEKAYIVELMDIENATKIVNWKYEPPYSFYNMSDTIHWTEDPEEIEELMDGSYFSVSTLNNELIGFYCYGQNAQVPDGVKQGLYMEERLDIGLGLRPDLTGNGNGYFFVRKGLEFGQSKYETTAFRLTVASFNHRAISLYKKVGFRNKETFIHTVGDQEVEFLLMEKL